MSRAVASAVASVRPTRHHAPGMTSPLRAGDEVDVFYRFSRDSGGYFPVDFAAAGALRPRVGRTDGWISALVEKDWPGEHGGAPGRRAPRARHSLARAACAMRIPAPSLIRPTPPPRPHRTGGASAATGGAPLVRIRHTHPYWVDRDGDRLNPADPSSMLVWVPRADVRPRAASREVPRPLSFSLSAACSYDLGDLWL